MFDNGRTVMNYGVAYYWAYLHTVLSDGRTLMLDFGDGIGSETYHKGEAYEDCAILDGKFVKLDITTLSYDKNNLKNPMKLETTTSNKNFPDSGCKLYFATQGVMEEGIDLKLLSFKQYFAMGYFTGECTIAGEKIELKDVYGSVEHAYTRM